MLDPAFKTFLQTVQQYVQHQGLSDSPTAVDTDAVVQAFNQTSSLTLVPRPEHPDYFDVVRDTDIPLTQNPHYELVHQTRILGYQDASLIVTNTRYVLPDGCHLSVDSEAQRFTITFVSQTCDDQGYDPENGYQSAVIRCPIWDATPIEITNEAQLRAWLNPDGQQFFVPRDFNVPPSVTQVDLTAPGENDS